MMRIADITGRGKMANINMGKPVKYVLIGLLLLVIGIGLWGAGFTPGQRTAADSNDNALTTEVNGLPRTDPVEYWGVIVGIADYPPPWNDLYYSDNDAQDVYDGLLGN